MVQTERKYTQTTDRKEAPFIPKYQSPYLDLLRSNPGKKFRELGSLLVYSNNFDNTLVELEDEILSPDFDPTGIKLLHPPRIIRAILDYTVKHPDENLHALLSAGVELGSSVYKKNYTQALQLINSIGQAVQTLPELSEAWILQDSDGVTWSASDPTLSQESAENIHKYTGGSDIILISLAHGSTSAALDVFNFYEDISGSQNSLHFPVRLSAHKLKDLKPKLDRVTLSNIINESEDKKVIIFDEDLDTGNTLNIARSFFEQKLSFDCQIKICVNRSTFGHNSFI